MILLGTLADYMSTINLLQQDGFSEFNPLINSIAAHADITLLDALFIHTIGIMTVALTLAFYSAFSRLITQFLVVVVGLKGLPAIYNLLLSWHIIVEGDIIVILATTGFIAYIGYRQIMPIVREDPAAALRWWRVIVQPDDNMAGYGTLSHRSDSDISAQTSRPSHSY